jgi:hypothetical protein
MKHIITFLNFLMVATVLFAQNVGIGTNAPLARLHVADSSVVFTSGTIMDQDAPPAPVSTTGSRMMWYAPKAAFRAGYVSGAQWNAANIGRFSLAAGHNAVASGVASTAFGSSAVAAGVSSFAAVSSSQANGNQSIAMGQQAVANGDFTVALGTYAQAYQDNSVSIGFAVQADAVHAMALGMGTSSNSYGHTVMGAYNAIYNGNTGSWLSTDPIFSIGNGSSSYARSTALTVLKNGNTGIGIIQPQARLQVNGQLMVGLGAPQATFHLEGNGIIRRNSYQGGAHLVLEETQSGDGSRLQFRNDFINDKSWEVYAKPHASNSNDAVFNVYYESVGNAMTIRGNGNVSVRGTLSQNSDTRLKKDIEPLQSSPDKITRLNGYRYHWKDEQLDQQWQTGLLAQEVEQVFPELVKSDADGIKSVNYTALIPHLIETIKSLQTRITALETKK